MIQNYTVIWDTSKTLLISEFLYWLQVFGYLTIWSCLKKTPQDLKCVVLKHRCPKVPLLCPHVLSVTLVSSPLLPDQFRLSHLRKCNWCKIAPQQMWLTFPHLSSSSWLTTLDEGRNGLVWGEKGQDLGHQWSPIPWYQFSRRCWTWAALLLLHFHPWLWSSAPSLCWFLLFRWTCVCCFWGTELAANGAQSQQYTK